MLDTKIESSDLKEIKGHLITLLSIVEGFAQGGGFSYSPSDFVSYAIKVAKMISKLEEKYGVKDVG